MYRPHFIAGTRPGKKSLVIILTFYIIVICLIFSDLWLSSGDVMDDVLNDSDVLV